MKRITKLIANNNPHLHVLYYTEDEDAGVVRVSAKFTGVTVNE